MSLSDSHAAIGAVTEFLQNRLTAMATTTLVGRPEVAAAASGDKLNLFLYQIEIDGSLRNRPYDTGQPSCLWLVLHYLLTAYDGNDSDSVVAHRLLGQGMLALEQLSILRPIDVALENNPEPLKISFDGSDTELLSKVMQGTDERYRLSVAFQVRPVMLVPGVAPNYALPVQTVGPAGDEGVVVLPTLGPGLERVEPASFAPGELITLHGTDLGSAIDSVCFGQTCYPVIAAPPGRLQVRVPVDTQLSAGPHAVTAVRELPSGRRMATNALLGNLRPVLTAISHGPLTPAGSGRLFGVLQLGGARLGGSQDAIFVAFHRDGAVRLMLEGAGSASQIALSVNVSADDALAPGRYQIILRVNGVQAATALEVDWS